MRSMVIYLSSYVLPTTYDLFIARYTSSPAATTTPHSGDLFVHVILPDDIFTLFTEILKAFDPISGQPTESHLVELCEVISQILLSIHYDRENVIHNLTGLIQDPKMYTEDYTTAFPCT